MKLDVEFICRKMPGQNRSGDAAVVKRHAGWTLFGVIDGLGHGDKAFDAAQAGVEILESMVPGSPVEKVMEDLDGALRSTRGAAATVCVAEDHTLTGCGVGNVEIRGRGASIPWVLTPGILGRGVRKLRVFSGQLRPFSRIVLFSDGLSGRFAVSDFDRLQGPAACEAMMARHARSNDDATVMVVDIGG